MKGPKEDKEKGRCYLFVRMEDDAGLMKLKPRSEGRTSFFVSFLSWQCLHDHAVFTQAGLPCTPDSMGDVMWRALTAATIVESLPAM